MSRIKIETGCYYHVYNRGVDKRITFENDSDSVRFIHSLYFCNDTEIQNLSMKRNVESSTLNIGERHKRSGNKLINILCFSLMPNHYHLLVKQVAENGISLFMHRLGTAYTNYFNKKYERNGSLFQGRYKIKQITNEEYLAYLSKYIHLNPVEILQPNWQEKGINDRTQADIFLNSYKWSSYQDYVGIKNFPSVIDKDILSDFYPNPNSYKEFISSFLVREMEQIKHML